MSSHQKNLKNFRNKKNLTQQELADILSVTKNTIGNYENEREENYLGGYQLIKLSLSYPDIPLEYFLGLTESMEKVNYTTNKQLGLSDKAIKKLEEMSSSTDTIQKQLFQFALNQVIENIDLEFIGTYLITPSIKNKAFNMDDETIANNRTNPNYYFDNYQINFDNENLQNFKIIKYLNKKFEDIKSDTNISTDYEEIKDLIDKKYNEEESKKDLDI